MYGAHLNLQVHWSDLWVWNTHVRRILRVLFSIGTFGPPWVFLSHHQRLQDVATPTIQSKEPLVEVHLDSGGLKVEGHQLDPAVPHLHGVVV